jgi:hypothetical protein
VSSSHKAIEDPYGWLIGGWIAILRKVKCNVSRELAGDQVSAPDIILLARLTGRQPYPLKTRPTFNLLTVHDPNVQ